MSRLVGALGPLFAYLCVGTILAQGIVVGYVIMQGTIDHRKMVDILAIAHGLDLEDANTDGLDPENESREQPSLQDNRELRAEITRDIELKEQLVLDAKVELNRIRNEMAGDRTAFDIRRRELLKTLDKEKKKAKELAQLEVVSILQTSKPKQAKSQLMLMWDRKEKERVVGLMIAMSERSRKKIVAEFKSEEDEQTLSEILQRIADGGNIVKIAEGEVQALEDQGILRNDGEDNPPLASGNRPTN